MVADPYQLLQATSTSRPPYRKGMLVSDASSTITLFQKKTQKNHFWQNYFSILPTNENLSYNKDQRKWNNLETDERTIDNQLIIINTCIPLDWPKSIMKQKWNPRTSRPKHLDMPQHTQQQACGARQQGEPIQKDPPLQGVDEEMHWLLVPMLVPMQK